MKLEIEDIQERVSRTEDERADWRMMAEQWERMYSLEPFKESRETALKNGREQVILPDPYNVVNLGARLLSNMPKIEIPVEDATLENEDSAEQRKRFLTSLWQRASYDAAENVIEAAKHDSFLYGRFCFEIKWVKDSLPKLMRKRRCPINIRVLDPRNVGCKRGPLYPLWAYHKYDEDIIDVVNRYPDVKDKLRDKWDAREKGGRGWDVECEVVDFWYTTDEGEIWNAVSVDDECFIKEPAKTDYPYIPIVEGVGENGGFGILHPINGIWQYQCRLASQMATGLLWYFWPAILLKSETGNASPEIRIGPGLTTPMPARTEAELIQFNVNVPMSDAMMNMVQGANQQSTFPGVMYGQAPGQVQAGFGVSLLADSAKGRVNPFRQNLEFAISTVNEIALAMVEEFGGDDGVAVWGLNEATDEVQHIVLTPEQVSGFYENHVSLVPQVPDQDLQKMVTALRMVEMGIISRDTFRKKFADVDLPSNEEKKLVWESLAFGEGPLAEFIRDEVVAERLEIPDWKLLLQEIQQQEKQMMQEMSQQGQPQPPGGAPGNGPPPGPGAGPPSSGGMPTGPSGPPPGPQMRPPRGSEAPPMQASQVMPNSPMPPEIQGQISPEALGLPPNTPPEVFQGLLGQLQSGQITMDELRAMLGDENG